MDEQINFEYDVKCRKCNKITRILFGTNNTTTTKDFTRWIGEHGSFPVHNKCTCDNERILLHDVIGYGDGISLDEIKITEIK